MHGLNERDVDGHAGAIDRVDQAGAAPAVAGGSRLPEERTTFVGRAAELAALRASVAEHRLTTITGPVGVGKSRLALHAARRWGRTFDEIRLLDGRRAPIRDLATELELLTIEPTTAPGVTRLVVIDHVDDDLERIVDLVDRLVDARPRLTVLHVGQRRLGLDGERLLPLRPFGMPDAAASEPLGLLVREDPIALFLDRAGSVRPGFGLLERDREPMLAIVRELGGLPIALELAAERVRALTIAEIAEQLATGLDLLRPSGAAVAVADRSIESRFAAAAARCTEPERIVWIACAAFGGGIDLAALAEVTAALGGDPAEVPGIVSALVDRSVLLPANRGDRPTLPVVARRYAAALDPGAVSTASAVHAGILRGLAATVRAEWFTLDQGALFGRLRADASNIRVAIDWLIGSGRPEAAAEAIGMLGDLRFHWASSAEFEFARDRLAAAAATPGLPPSDLLHALATTVYFELRAGDPARAADVLDRARALEAELPPGAVDPGVAGMLDYDAGIAHLIAGDLEAATAVLDAVVRARTRADEPMSADAGEAFFADAWANVLRDASAPDAADELVAGFIAQAERGGDLWGQAYMMSISAIRALDDGEVDRALADALAALRVMDTLGDRSGTVLFLRIVGVVEAAARRFDRAARLLSAPLRTTHLQTAMLRRHVDRAETALRAAMSDRDRDRLRRDVAGWGIDDAVASALERSASAGPTASGAAATGEPRGGASTGIPGASAMEALSPRELEIAALVARGLPNLAIAAHLVISRRTVEGHVQKILQKLAFTSRTQVAAWYVQYVDPRRRSDDSE